MLFILQLVQRFVSSANLALASVSRVDQSANRTGPSSWLASVRLLFDRLGCPAYLTVLIAEVVVEGARVTGPEIGNRVLL